MDWKLAATWWKGSRQVLPYQHLDSFLDTAANLILSWILCHPQINSQNQYINYIHLAGQLLLQSQLYCWLGINNARLCNMTVPISHPDDYKTDHYHLLSSGSGIREDCFIFVPSTSRPDQVFQKSLLLEYITDKAIYGLLSCLFGQSTHT